jgi:hypothetical protein
MENWGRGDLSLLSAQAGLAAISGLMAAVLVGIIVACIVTG